MPISRFAPTQPAAALCNAVRERDVLSRALSTRWPRAAPDVLVIAARVDRFDRRAPGLGLALIAAADP